MYVSWRKPLGLSCKPFSASVWSLQGPDFSKGPQSSSSSSDSPQHVSSYLFDRYFYLSDQHAEGKINAHRINGDDFVYRFTSKTGGLVPSCLPLGISTRTFQWRHWLPFLYPLYVLLCVPWGCSPNPMRLRGNGMWTRTWGSHMAISEL